MFGLEDRTVLVTGASRGIGRALAIGLADAGADVIVAARSRHDLEAVADDVRGRGRTCEVVEADVADVKSTAMLFETLKSRNIVADILVNNAGIEQVRASTEVDEELWDRIIDTNLKGAFFVAQHFAKVLLASNSHGSVINLGSLTSAVGVPTAAPYTSSKSGLLGMTRALSSEWSPLGIRVNAIGPGYFRTALTESFYADEGWQQSMLNSIPINRFGELDDLVGIAVFLASHASSYITGQIIYVDGGYLASI